MWNRDDIVFAVGVVQRKGNAISGREFKRLFRNLANTNLRPLNIGQDGNHDPFFARYAADVVNRFVMSFMLAVREIDAGDVHPRTNHLAQQPFIARRWADRGDNLGTFSVDAVLQGSVLPSVSAYDPVCPSPAPSGRGKQEANRAMDAGCKLKKGTRDPLSGW